MFFYQSLWPAGLLKRSLWNRRFLVNIANFLRTNFLQNTSGGLLLKYISKMRSILWRLWDVSKMSLTSIWLFKNTPQKRFPGTSLELLKHLIKYMWNHSNHSRNKTFFRAVHINQVCHEYQWADVCVVFNHLTVLSTIVKAQ